MPIFVVSLSQIAGLVLGLAACAYLVLALRSAAKRRAPVTRRSAWQPAVSVLKPVYGTEPLLYDCLRSFCVQDWPEYEVIFSAHSHDDPAVAVIEKLIADLPDRDIRLVVDTSLAGPNRKAANLANGYKVARHDFIVLADSDVMVDRDCIAAMVGPFIDQSVGAVACAYKGLPTGTPASEFLALGINNWMLPSILVDTDLRGIDFVFGAMSAVRRSALDAIGGFARLAGFLAEDFQMGQLVAEAGWRVEMSPYTCGTVATADTFKQMFDQEVRWQRTERVCRPVDHTMSVVTWALLPMLLLLLLPQPTWVGVGLIGLQIVLRLMIHHQLRRNFTFAAPSRPWLVPLRDCVCFVEWAVSLFPVHVRWRDQVFTVARDGRLMGGESAMR